MSQAILSMPDNHGLWWIDGLVRTCFLCASNIEKRTNLSSRSLLDKIFRNVQDAAHDDHVWLRKGSP